MAVLRSGGTAVDAVEMAIKVLEDREITNAGYGSNLAMNGTVECDATIVDHYGRSGVVFLKFAVLTTVLRGPKPHLCRSARTGTLHNTLVPPSRATKSPRWTRSNRLRF